MAVHAQEAEARSLLQEAIGKFDAASQRYYRHMAQINGCPFLVVEDEEGVQDMLRTILQTHRRKVEVAGSVKAACRLLEQRGRKGFATIILDMGLPDGTGLDVIRWLREREWVVPIIIYTGMSNVEKYLGRIVEGYPNIRIEQKGDTDVRLLAKKFGIEGS